MPGRLLQVADGAGDAGVVEPRLAVAQIELAQGCCQPAFKSTSRKLARSVNSGTSVSPSIHCQPMRLELLAEGLLDEFVFPLDGATRIAGV